MRVQAHHHAAHVHQVRKLKALPPRLKPLPDQVPMVEPGSWRTDKQTSTQRGYGYRWQQYRNGWLRRHSLCGDRLNERSPQHSQCARDGRAVPGTDVDHIIPHRGDQSLFWDETNHQTLCSTCHKTIKAAAEQTGGEA